MIGYPLERLSEEVAYIAYHFHWSPDHIMNLEHAERRRWVAEIARINQRIRWPTWRLSQSMPLASLSKVRIVRFAQSVPRCLIFCDDPTRNRGSRPQTLQATRLAVISALLHPVAGQW